MDLNKLYHAPKRNVSWSIQTETIKRLNEIIEERKIKSLSFLVDKILIEWLDMYDQSLLKEQEVKK